MESERMMHPVINDIGVKTQNEFVKEEKRRGKCIVFSTHNISEAEYLCDKIGFIFKGTLLDQGSSSYLIKKYSSRNLTEAFLKALSIGESKL